MCNKRRTRELDLKGKILRLDACMVDEISAFNLEGHISLGCCCGHGVYAKTVVYQDGDLIKEWYSGVVIPRRRRYYLTDDEGYYYIPELFTKEGYIL